jgi:pimeloyl-ACP methyl ester carboxylesterase
MAWDTHDVNIPDVHYARAGGVAIAYQVVGDGPQTVVFSPQIADLYTLWLSGYTRSFLERVSQNVRVVVFNPRGTGLSDRPRNVTLEARMDDISAVLDHLAASRVSLLGLGMGAGACALFAASYPERVEHLVLVHPSARTTKSESYPWGFEEEGWLGWIRENREHWGEREFMERYAWILVPEIAENPEELELFIWRGRLSLSPSAAGDWARLALETDIIDILSSIRVPTLVLHRPDDSYATTAHGLGPAQFVADRIRGSRTLALHSDMGSPFSREAA